MPPATNEEQFRFLISCIRWSNNGRVDFQEVANECNVVSKGAAAKRYERMMRSHGIHPNGGPLDPSARAGSGSSPSVPRARQAKAARDGSDRYGKASKNKATSRAAAKAAQFEDPLDADMDDEEPELSSHIKDEPIERSERSDDTNDSSALERLVVKAENDEYGGYGDNGQGERYEDLESGAGHASEGQYDGAGSPRPRALRLATPSISSSLAAQFGGGGIVTPSSTSPGFAYSITSPSPSSPTVPQNDFDFNAYTPRQTTPGPAPFFSGTGVRTPEEVHGDGDGDEEMVGVAGDAKGEGEVVLLD